MREERIKKKKRKLNRKNLFKLILFLVVIFVLVYYLFNIRVTHIKIVGTKYISDNEIIEASNLKYYPKLFSVPIISIKNNIKKLPLVNKVKVSKNLYGKVTIEIDENKVLFYNKTSNKIVLSNNEEVDYLPVYLGVASLINYVPSEIYQDLISGLSLIDDDILKLISEIEYSPSKTISGEVIDDHRFLLRMNDGNTVYMNTINIKKLNKYLEITATILNTNKETSGILYFDSSIGDSFSFESYDSIKRQDEKKKLEEEEKKKEEEKNESTSQN